MYFCIITLVSYYEEITIASICNKCNFAYVLCLTGLPLDPPLVLDISPPSRHKPVRQTDSTTDLMFLRSYNAKMYSNLQLYKYLSPLSFIFSTTLPVFKNLDGPFRIISSIFRNSTRNQKPLYFRRQKLSIPLRTFHHTG